MSERHRRKCEEWNKTDSKTNYLDKIIEVAPKKTKKEDECITNGSQGPSCPMKSSSMNLEDIMAQATGFL
ncbi:hypothetical protein [Desulfocicer niacini]